MSFLVAAVNSLNIDFGGDDDQVDKLSRQYTVALLIVFCVVVSTKQYVGDPISCWVPATFTPSMREYTDNMCWIKNTYYIPVDHIIPNKDEDIKTELNYYQWVPIVLTLQALLFYLPYMMWRGLNSRIGCDLRSTVKVLTDASMLNQEVHDKSIRFATAHIDKFLVSRKRSKDATLCSRLSSILCLGKRFGNYMVTMYALTKVFYFGNALCQLFMLNKFVGNYYDMYGVQIVNDLISGREAGESPRFPRSTLCSFKVREFGGNTHRHTVQCVLPVNLFNEKIYIFLWFWLVLVAIVTFFSLVSWVWATTAVSRISFCKGYLKQVPSDTFAYGQRDKPLVARFANTYLRQDGAFILRLLAKNVNSVVVSEIILALYVNYQKMHHKMDDDSDNSKGCEECV